MPLPENVSTDCPLLLSTIRHPAPAAAAVPSVVGRLPTTTKPELRATSAVVSPTPPGHAGDSEATLICAKTLSVPLGEI